MIDLLLINPKESATALVRALATNNISYQIVATPGETFVYAIELQVIDLSTAQWDDTKKYKSAVAYNKEGQRWLDNISDQVTLHNRPIKDRTQYYINDINAIKADHVKMFNLISYKGRHVLVDASVCIDSKFNLIQDQLEPAFENEVENVFAFLDDIGVLNGPCQVFIKPDSTMLVRLAPSSPTAQTNRKFWHIWSKIILLEIDQPKKAILTFYGWINHTGSAKRFQLETGL